MKKLILSLIIIFTLLLLWVNLKLYSENFTRKEKHTDILQQLIFLEKELKTNNLGQRMQDVFPEGFVFTNVLYGLSWCEIATSDLTNNKELKERALSEALFAYNEISSDKARSTFDNQLTPEDGIFYVGWRNYLLSKIIKSDTTFHNFQRYKRIYSEQCEIIIDALEQSNSPYLQSYYNQAWPADMFVAMTSVSNHDKIFKSKYESEIKNWLTDVKEKLDPKTKMIPHKVLTNTAKTVEGARGSSISLIIRLLSEIQPDFAKEQYSLYKKNFVTTTFGLPSISEYPKGESGDGDIDSGPVIFGVGFSGTIVSIGTFSMLGDFELAEKQYKTINAFGFGNKTENEKSYAFGLLPIADAFILWGRVAELNHNNSMKPISCGWRIKFHAISTIILSVLWLLVFYKKLNTNRF